MKINLKELRKRSEYINENKNNNLDLIIWNYNQKAQFDGFFDEYILQTRGMITDMEGNIIARPFKKFFNLNEKEETKIENLPAELPKITIKMDGSLIIQFYDGNNICMATRGSFNSEQAIWATKWIRERFKKEDFLKGYTYLYEEIGSHNRIVVKYNTKELILLAVINTETLEEINHISEAKRLRINYAKPVDKPLNELVELLPSLNGNEEGFVVRYSNGLRVKMKGTEYARLHRLITKISNKSVWDLLMNNQPFDELLEKVPDEFFNWVKKTKKDLEDKYKELESKAKEGYEKTKNLPTRKEQAIEIIKNYKDVSTTIFMMLDNKDYSNMLWIKLKPIYSNPFKEEN